MGNLLRQRLRPAEVLAELPEGAIETVTRMVSPDDLSGLRQISDFAWQRRIRVPTVKRYAAAMFDGTFIGPCATVCIVEEVDKAGSVIRTFLVNGNHTAEAVFQYGRPVLLTMQHVKVLLTKDRESGFTLAEEVARVLYSGFDRALARDRHARDKAWAINGGIQQMPARMQGAMISAVKIIATQFPDNPRTIDQGVKIQLAADIKLNDLRTMYTRPALRIASLISQYPKNDDQAIAHAPPFLAVCLELMKADQGTDDKGNHLPDAEEFLVRVVAGEGSEGEPLESNDPVLKLRDDLIGLYGKKQYGKRRHIGEIARKVAQAWNLFHAGVTELKNFSKRYVFRLDGTPWTEVSKPEPLITQQESIERVKSLKNEDLIVPNPKVAA